MVATTTAGQRAIHAKTKSAESAGELTALFFGLRPAACPAKRRAPCDRSFILPGCAPPSHFHFTFLLHPKLRDTAASSHSPRPPRLINRDESALNSASCILLFPPAARVVSQKHSTSWVPSTLPSPPMALTWIIPNRSLPSRRLFPKACPPCRRCNRNIRTSIARCRRRHQCTRRIISSRRWAIRRRNPHRARGRPSRVDTAADAR